MPLLFQVTDPASLHTSVGAASRQHCTSVARNNANVILPARVIATNRSLHYEELLLRCIDHKRIFQLVITLCEEHRNLTLVGTISVSRSGHINVFDEILFNLPLEAQAVQRLILSSLLAITNNITHCLGQEQRCHLIIRLHTRKNTQTCGFLQYVIVRLFILTSAYY